MVSGLLKELTCKEIASIESHLEKAYECHPNFVDNKFEAMSVLMEEVGEISQYFNYQKEQSIICDKDYIESVVEEVDDTIAVLIRIRRNVKKLME